MQDTLDTQQDAARHAFNAAAHAFDLGRPEDLPEVVDSADMALRLLEVEASEKAGPMAKPLISSLIGQTKTILAKSKPQASRADLRVVLLCVALLMGVAGHPWVRTVSGAEYCHSCGSHRLVRSNRGINCMDCGWRDETTEQG